MLKDVYGGGQTVVVCEHDNGPRTGQLEQLLACPCDWGGFAYDIGGYYLACLGFTKFTAQLQAEYPDLMDAVGEIDDAGLEAKHWMRLDVRIAGELARRGHRPIHEHFPPVDHYRNYGHNSCPWPPGPREDRIGWDQL